MDSIDALHGPRAANPATPPPSVTNFGINLCAAAAGMGTFAALVHWRGGMLDPIAIVVWSGAAIALVVALGEFLWRGLPDPADCGLNRDPLRGFDPAVVFTRLLGFAVTLAAVACAYWLFPEYHGAFYDPFWRFLRLLAPAALPAIVAYFLWSTPRLEQPSDAYWWLGSAVLGRRPPAAAVAPLRDHALAWTVKAYFLPLMAVYAGDQVKDVAKVFEDIGASGLTQNSFALLFRMSYTVDLLFCVVGYVLTVRVLDSHIRSTEPTVLGWLVALICYQPFFSVIGTYYLRYDDNRPWGEYFSAYPVLSACWGFGILLLVMIYGLSTAAFGLRFSNLTYRGIVTNGPYRYSKHPAYVSKNLSWWMISVPFLSSDGWSAALRHSLLLALLNTVYFLRAKTEERHLRRDPRYIAYAAWIAEHGLLGRCWRGLRVLRRRFGANPRKSLSAPPPSRSESRRPPP
jgi:protein-S-isoprenylcysteine O-methyltransferase Ste14